MAKKTTHSTSHCLPPNEAAATCLIQSLRILNTMGPTFPSIVSMALLIDGWFFPKNIKSDLRKGFYFQLSLGHHRISLFSIGKIELYSVKQTTIFLIVLQALHSSIINTAYNRSQGFLKGR